MILSITLQRGATLLIFPHCCQSFGTKRTLVPIPTLPSSIGWSLSSSSFLPWGSHTHCSFCLEFPDLLHTWLAPVRYLLKCHLLNELSLNHLIRVGSSLLFFDRCVLFLSFMAFQFLFVFCVPTSLGYKLLEVRGHACFIHQQVLSKLDESVVESMNEVSSSVNSSLDICFIGLLADLNHRCTWPDIVYGKEQALRKCLFPFLPLGAPQPHLWIVWDCFILCSFHHQVLHNLPPVCLRFATKPVSACCLALQTSSTAPWWTILSLSTPHIIKITL